MNGDDDYGHAARVAAQLAMATDDRPECKNCGEPVGDEQPITRVADGRVCGPDCAFQYHRERAATNVFERASEMEGA